MNIITITGSLGRDADLRETPAGKAVLNFSIANNSGFGDNKKTFWFRCALWGDRARKLAEHFTKGTKLLVSGEMQLREYEKDGEKKISPEIFVKDFDFIGGKKGESANDGFDGAASDELDAGLDQVPF